MVGPNAELTRHPQEFLKVRSEKPIPFANQQEDNLLNRVLCTPEGKSAYAGIGIAGCMIAGLTPGIDLPTPEPLPDPIVPPDFFLLQEDGISQIILEDGSGNLGLE